ncbi:MAG TPA: thiamine phosphate synthase [Gemmatimonadaceae bacterium]|nr:thiamine phosphate synthase [Gemmatimonadaceae bacterium]
MTSGLDPGLLRLLAITDDLRDGREGLVGRARAAVRGGATMVQLRLKGEDARTLVEVARALIATLAVPVVVNDRADVALAAGAAGVHLGVDDLPPAAVRRVVPPEFIIGASVGDEAEVANAAGADYAGIGPVWVTASKADAGGAIGVEGFARLAGRLTIPSVAIGGVTAENAAAVAAAGAAGVAVIRALFAARDPEQAARALRVAIGR